MKTEGLLTLRDIAQPAGAAASSALATSSDRRRVAFFISQPVVEVNDTCETLVVLDVDRPNALRTADSGGGAIAYEQAIHGLRYSSGVLETNIPVFSPDDRALVYRKRMHGRTQAWLVRLDGAPAQQLTHASEDVEAVGWSADGRRVLYTVRPGRAAARAAVAAEGRVGILYDARVKPSLGSEPQLPAELPEEIMAIPVAGGDAARASARDRADFKPPVAVSQSLVSVQNEAGQIASTSPVDATLFAPARPFVTEPDGTRAECSHSACAGTIRNLWWHGGEVMFLKRDGWHREDSVIQAWSPRQGSVRTVVRSEQRLSDCTSAAPVVLCIAEDARHPRRIIAIDPARGQVFEFFNPNPQVDPADLPAVQRLRWRNRLGLEAWADLVLPAGTPPPGGWPMVVVQYRSDGFLKGGSGDEYPIFPMVDRGIAVFSFQAPEYPPTGYSRADDVGGTVAALHRNWSKRRSVHDSLMTGLDLALAKGSIDKTRIGITGLSDGSTTARFALINEKRFAAAAISTCCLEPVSIMALSGPATADWFRRVGFPNASQPDPDFWRPVSMALNADHMDAPMLMQLAEAEFVDGLETFNALREHGKPVELYVFPGEFHIKTQPVHRAAIYERSIDWFSFWLQDYIDRDPAKAAQYNRWKALKTAE